MRLPNWFKVVWWILLVGAVGSFLYARLTALLSGQASPLDALVVLVWLALLLLPVAQEIRFLGVVTFKQQVEALKADIHRELASIRNEVQANVNIRQNFSPQFWLTAPSEAQLASIKVAVDEALDARGLQRPTSAMEGISVSPEVEYMFAARYSMEVEIRRIHQKFTKGYLTIPNQTALRMASTLFENGVLDSDLLLAFRDVYRLCSVAIHGEDVSKEQVESVQSTAPGLIRALKSITPKPLG